MTDPGAARYAFVDVDHCLITTSSVTSFARYYFADGPNPVDPDHFERVAAQTGDLASTGASRTEILVCYYTLWAGQSRYHVLRAAHQWHDTYPDLYHEPVMNALDRHRRNAVRIVLVSASFREVLLPIAARVGAVALVCTDLLTDDGGVVTDDPVTPVVGQRKLELINQITGPRSRQGRRGLGDHAYGDHHSDLPMLTAVDHPVVVGGDHDLLATALENNWTVLPAAARSTT